MNPVTETTVESAPKLIIAAWLAAWFDGNSHTIGTNDPVLFPKSNIRFGQGEVGQPISEDVNGQKDGIASEIRVVIVRRNEMARTTNDSVSGATKTVTIYCSLQFTIRAKKLAAGASDGLADNIAQLLKAIATNPVTRYATARAGIRHLLPQKPETLQSADYTIRLLVCSAEITYALNFTPATAGGIAAPAATDLQIPFTRESPILPGDYLLGQYSWPTLKTITSLTVVGLPPQATPLTLTLEINGAITAINVTIAPSGTPLTPTTTSAALNALLPPNSTVRWLATSGDSNPALAAWMLSLVMRVQ